MYHNRVLVQLYRHRRTTNDNLLDLKGELTSFSFPFGFPDDDFRFPPEAVPPGSFPAPEPPASEPLLPNAFGLELPGCFFFVKGTPETPISGLQKDRSYVLWGTR